MNHKNRAQQCIVLALVFIVFLCSADQALCQSVDEGKALYTKAVELQDQGRYKEAVPYAEKSLEIFKKLYGEKNQFVAVNLETLAELYKAAGDTKKAGKYLNNAKDAGAKAESVNTSKGCISGNCVNGKGTYIDADGNKYAGVWKDGKPHGKGTFTKADGSKYIGDFRDGAQYGKGTAIGSDGSQYIGEWRDGKRHGHGTQIWPDSSKHTGEWDNDIPLGQNAAGAAQGNAVVSPAALEAFNTAAKLKEQGKYSEAITRVEKALEMFEKENGTMHTNVAVSCDLLGQLFSVSGNYSAAEPLYKRALAIQEKAQGADHPDFATSLNNLAAMYDDLGDYSAAEPLYKRALAIREKALGSDHPDVANSLNNLAQLYYKLGNYSAADPLFKRSLAIREKSLGPNHPGVALSLHNLAMLYNNLGNYSAAEPLYKRALAIYEKALGPDHPSVAISLNNLASLHLATGRLNEAYKVYNESNNAMGLGEYYLVKKEFAEAQKQFQKSLDNDLKSDRKLPHWLITDYTGLGLAYEGQRSYTEARTNFQKAIDLNEQQWQTLSVSAKRNFMAGKVGADFKRIEPYEGMVRVLLKEGKTGCEKEALKYAEMVKSRLFLEQLAGKGSTGKTSQDSAVLAKDHELQQQVAMLRTRLTKLAELGTRAPAGDLAQVSKEFAKASAEYEKFLNEVKLSGSEVSSLVNVEIIAAEDLQKLIDADTTILEYYTAQDKTYAWVITKSSIKTVEIPRDTKQLADKVNEFRLANISNRSRRPVPVMTLATSEKQAEATEGQRQKNREQYAVLSEEFYKELIAPVAKDLTTPKLIIVPHGSLHKVPFSSLSDGKQYLVDRYAITVLPAASVAKYIGAKRKKETGKLFAVSNPKTEYTPLAFAEEEVKSIGKLFNDKEVYAEEKATESTVKDKAKQAGILHFACHGEFNDMQPLQSGLILAKDGANDGYLQVHEIFSLNLEKANIVALSACETALSRIQGGDDLVGLSRGFIYAGTPSLLASLWQVDDRATGELMEKFYDNWQNKKMAKPEALRQAQLSIKSKPEYSHPFYWAAFEMIGDWQ